MQELSYLKGHFNLFLERAMLPAIRQSFPKEIAGVVCYALEAPGKRIRPALCLMAAGFPMQKKPTELQEAMQPLLRDKKTAATKNTAPLGNPVAALPERQSLAHLYAAFALECIHTYSLLHDDLPAMDDDDLRRGRPTAHKAYSEWEAILAGDALNTYAFACLCKIGPITGADVALELSGILAEASGMGGMVGGQTLDLFYEKKQLPGQSKDSIGEKPKTPSFQNFSTPSPSVQSPAFSSSPPKHNPEDLKILKKIHSMKTAALLSASCEMGAVLAGASEANRGVFKTYGKKLGLLFQIVDDLLDATGNAEELGKAVGKDADRGKWTYPGLLGLEGCHAEAQNLVQELRQLARAIATKDRTDFWDKLPNFIYKRKQ